MSLKLYLDDCAYSRRLVTLLQQADHDVEIPGGVTPTLIGADDAVHFAHAQATGRVLLTYNARDFKALHDGHPTHAGIFAVYQDNDPRKDMSYRDIVQAIENLLRTATTIKGEFWVLNVYRW